MDTAILKVNSVIIEYKFSSNFITDRIGDNLSVVMKLEEFTVAGDDNP